MDEIDLTLIDDFPSGPLDYRRANGAPMVSDPDEPGQVAALQPSVGIRQVPRRRGGPGQLEDLEGDGGRRPLPGAADHRSTPPGRGQGEQEGAARRGDGQGHGQRERRSGHRAARHDGPGGGPRTTSTSTPRSSTAPISTPTSTALPTLRAGLGDGRGADGQRRLPCGRARPTASGGDDAAGRPPTGPGSEPGELIIGDLKTGKKLDFSLPGYCVQMALYATGQLYDVVTRAPPGRRHRSTSTGRCWSTCPSAAASVSCRGARSRLG